MKILYYDCFAGISGDMNLGALIDLGVDKDYLCSELKKLDVAGYSIDISKGLKNGISGTNVTITLEKDKQDAEHHHRRFSAIEKIISKSNVNDYVKDISIKIFKKIAEAEAKIHNKPLNEIHFHEVGAIDSIVDIVGAAICIDYLKPDKIVASTVELGGGFVECAHGTFPVPAPATAEILKTIPVKSGIVPYETTTPTGAAILATSVDEFSDSTDFIIEKIGYGLGNREYKIPNVLRVYLGEGKGKNSGKPSTSLIIESNIDDMNPELYDYVFELLFKAGANDVYITPIIMKKSRPAVTLSVLCTNDVEPEIEKILFEETSTLGLRKYKVEKMMLDRSIKYISTPYGKVRIKSAIYKGRELKSKPEYEDCLKIAREQQMALVDVYKLVQDSLLKEKM